MDIHPIDTDNSTALHAIRMAACAPGAGVAGTADNLATADNRQTTGVWNDPTVIRHIYPYTFFNKSPLQLRRIGALGGKAHGRNQRARRALLSTAPTTIPLRAAAQQTTAEAIAALDVRFPWLLGAERRHYANPSSRQGRMRPHHCAN